MIITLSKFICVSCNTLGSSDYLTPGKIYEITTQSWDGIYESISYFTGDDGKEYLFFKHDNDFTPIEEWRQNQLDKLI